MGKTINEKAMEIMAHALGGGTGREYRNHYAASAESPDYAICEQLVALGLMVKGAPLGYGDYFHVTDEGRAEIRKARAGAHP